MDEQNKDMNTAAAPEAVAATEGGGGAPSNNDQPKLKRVLKTSNMVYYGNRIHPAAHHLHNLWSCHHPDPWHAVLGICCYDPGHGVHRF